MKLFKSFALLVVLLSLTIFISAPVYSKHIEQLSFQDVSFNFKNIVIKYSSPMSSNYFSFSYCHVNNSLESLLNSSISYSHTKTPHTQTTQSD
jgi:type III secretory pathway component EscR